MDADAADRLDRFRSLLRIPTVSRSDASTDGAAFDEFRRALRAAYPRVFALEHQLVAEYSLLVRWPGRTAESPTVLMAHQDVVPAGEDGWTHPPFAAELDDEGVLWGRGTLDDKGSLVGILEAVEGALSRGFTPAHDVWLAFGHDEEVAGIGAAGMVDALEERSVSPGLVIDEGGAIVEGMLPGVPGAVAAVGVAEKGVATIELIVEQQGGHASTPPSTTATDRLARAILRLRRRPDVRGVPEPTIAMLEHAGARATGPAGLLLRRARALRPLLPPVLAALGPETAAMARTTRAVTQLRASDASNALAERAVATVNVRVAIGSSVAHAAEAMRRAIRDPAVTVRVVHGDEPSPVSPWDGEAWGTIAATISDLRPDALITPYVMRGASDARHFHRIADDVYRYMPFQVTTAQLAGLHAIDERIDVAAWLEGVDWYERLLRRL